MAGYIRDPLPAIPDNLPVPIEESGFGYAVRYPGRNQPWHWWCPDPDRPNVRVPIKCDNNRWVNGAEIALFEQLLARGERHCHRCLKVFQHLMIVMAGRPTSTLDPQFKKQIIRTKAH